MFAILRFSEESLQTASSQPKASTKLLKRAPHDGTLEAQTFAHVVSIAEEKKQRSLRPEPSKQLGLHLDSTPTVVTELRFLSTMPANTEALRAKYEVLRNK